MVYKQNPSLNSYWNILESLCQQLKSLMHQTLSQAGGCLILLVFLFKRYGKGLEASSHPSLFFFSKKVPETFAHGEWRIMDRTLAHLFLKSLLKVLPSRLKLSAFRIETKGWTGQFANDIRKKKIIAQVLHLGNFCQPLFFHPPRYNASYSMYTT